MKAWAVIDTQGQIMWGIIEATRKESINRMGMALPRIETRQKNWNQYKSWGYTCQKITITKD